jgi:putative hydrolase of the HAD superfamily
VARPGAAQLGAADAAKAAFDPKPGADKRSRMRITTVGLDADDTLWHNETIFRLTQDRFRDLMADVAAPEVLNARLAAVEHRNLALYGYGVKGFTLSLVETAMELTGGEPPGRVIADILAAGREMLAHPVETLPGVDRALAELSEHYRLVLITKGDLLHQEQKLAASGLGELFAAVEIVSEKDASTYARVFARHGTGAAEAAMAGNSLRSDILPALQAGAYAAHIPYALTWAHEMADAPQDHPRFAELASIADFPGWVRSRG